eukprot:291007-Hanusia_phi.AAC.2
MIVDEASLEGKAVNCSLSVHAFVAPAADPEQLSLSLGYFFRNNLDLPTEPSLMQTFKDLDELGSFLQHIQTSEAAGSHGLQEDHPDAKDTWNADMLDLLTRAKRNHIDSLGRTDELEVHVMNGCKILDDLKERIDGQRQICANLKRTLCQWEESLSKTASSDVQPNNENLLKHNIEFSSRRSLLDAGRGEGGVATRCSHDDVAERYNLGQSDELAKTMKDSSISKSDRERWIREQNKMTAYVSWLASKVFEKPSSPAPQNTKMSRNRESIVRSLSAFLHEKLVHRRKLLVFDAWRETKMYASFLRVVHSKIAMKARSRRLQHALNELLLACAGNPDSPVASAHKESPQLGVLSLRTLTVWRGVTTQQRAFASIKMKLARAGVRRVMIQTLRCWEEWMEQEKTRRRQLDMKTARSVRTALKDVFAVWRSNDEDIKRSSNLSAAESCLQLAFSLQNSCFQRWCLLCQNKGRMKRSFDRLLARQRLHMIALAFERWESESFSLQDMSESYAKASSPRTPDLSKLAGLEASPISDARSIPRYIPGIGFVGSSRTHVPPLNFANLSR